MSLFPSLVRPVFVDELMVRGAWSFGASCHLLPDGLDAGALEQLHAFARQLGLKRSWFQDKRWPHYDLTGSRRLAAVARGASITTTRIWLETHRSLLPSRVSP